MYVFLVNSYLESGPAANTNTGGVCPSSRYNIQYIIPTFCIWLLFVFLGNDPHPPAAPSRGQLSRPLAPRCLLLLADGSAEMASLGRLGAPSPRQPQWTASPPAPVGGGTPRGMKLPATPGASLIPRHAAGRRPPEPTAAPQHPFLLEIVEQIEILEYMHQRYQFYHRLLGAAALVSAGMLAALVILGDGNSQLGQGLGRGVSSLFASLNPFHSETVFSGLPSASRGRYFLAVCNLLLVMSLTTCGDLPGTAARNQEMASRFRELALSYWDALAADGGCELADSSLAQLQAKRQALEREAAHRQLMLYDPIAACWASCTPLLPEWICCCVKPKDETLLGGSLRSDDIEANQLSWLGGSINVLEKATGLDLDGDGTVSGRAKAGLTDATMNANSDNKEGSKSGTATGADDDDSDDDDEEDMEDFDESSDESQHNKGPQAHSKPQGGG